MWYISEEKWGVNFLRWWENFFQMGLCQVFHTVGLFNAERKRISLLWSERRKGHCTVNKDTQQKTVWCGFSRTGELRCCPSSSDKRVTIEPLVLSPSIAQVNIVDLSFCTTSKFAFSWHYDNCSCLSMVTNMSPSFNPSWASSLSTPCMV